MARQPARQSLAGRRVVRLYSTPWLKPAAVAPGAALPRQPAGKVVTSPGQSGQCFAVHVPYCELLILLRRLALQSRVNIFASVCIAINNSSIAAMCPADLACLIRVACPR